MRVMLYVAEDAKKVAEINDEMDNNFCLTMIVNSDNIKRIDYFLFEDLKRGFLWRCFAFGELEQASKGTSMLTVLLR